MRTWLYRIATNVCLDTLAERSTRMRPHWSATEVSDSLGMSTAAVNSALQRARATLAEKNLERHVERRSQYAPAMLTASQEALVDRYVEAYDVTSLMREDATTCMPPYSAWLQGRV